VIISNILLGKEPHLQAVRNSRLILDMCAKSLSNKMV